MTHMFMENDASSSTVSSGSCFLAEYRVVVFTRNKNTPDGRIALSKHRPDFLVTFKNS